MAGKKKGGAKTKKAVKKSPVKNSRRSQATSAASKASAKKSSVKLAKKSPVRNTQKGQTTDGRAKGAGATAGTQKSGSVGGQLSSSGAGTSRNSGVHVNDLAELGPEGRVDPSAWIHPRATVIGNVVLGPDCSLWPSSVLRADLGYITLGKAVNIQDGSVIHCDSGGRVEIGDYTLVGHRAMLHGCTVGRGALIGIGCVVLDGAEIGDGAMITAGCMIRGGMKIPARSMVVQKGGELKIYPNKARTQLTLAGSLEYVELARRWKAGEFHPLTESQEKELIHRAGIILKEMFSE